MQSAIFIPKQINVGFQNRRDTYTQKLAYVIYFDEKNKLRKEKSWDSWRDKTIDNIIHNNEPTEGFVLNKKVGDYSSSWNHRQAYVRVYDPRGFEFEITVENLLYILENTNSIKGKGLEGEFVYGWSGADLVLIPLSSPDYTKILDYNEIVHENKQIKAKDLVIGATYSTKDNTDYVYMGRFERWAKERVEHDDYSGRYRYTYEDVNKGKHHFFARTHKYSFDNEIRIDLITVKSLGSRFINVKTEEMAEDYAEIFELLEKHTDYSPLDKTKDDYIRYTFEEVVEAIESDTWSRFKCYDNNKVECEIRKSGKGDELYSYNRSNNYHNTETDTLEEIYNNIKPAYKNEYLANGKLYREGKVK